MQTTSDDLKFWVEKNFRWTWFLHLQPTRNPLDVSKKILENKKISNQFDEVIRISIKKICKIVFERAKIKVCVDLAECFVYFARISRSQQTFRYVKIINSEDSVFVSSSETANKKKKNKWVSQNAQKPRDETLKANILDFVADSFDCLSAHAHLHSNLSSDSDSIIKWIYIIGRVWEFTPESDESELCRGFNSMWRHWGSNLCR